MAKDVGVGETVVLIPSIIQALWKRIGHFPDPVRVFGLLASERVILMVVGLVRSKLAAMFLGPDGMGIVAQAMALQDLLRQTMTLGAGGGFLKLVAEAHGLRNASKLNQVATAVGGCVLLLSLVAGVMAIAIPAWLSLQVFGRADYSDYVQITVLGAVCLVNGNVLLILFQAFQEWRSLTVLNLIQGFLGALMAAWLMPTMGVKGALYGFVITYGIGWIVALFWVHRRLRNRYNWHYLMARPAWSVVTELVQYAGVFSLSYVATSVITLLVRKRLIETCGEAANGYYQVAWVASTTFLGVFGSLIWTYGMPKISSLQSPAEISRSQNQLAELLLSLATPIVVITILTKEWWIPMLFSRQFLAAGELVTFQLAAGWLELLRHALNVTILPQKRFTLYFVQVFFFSAMQLLGGYVAILFLGAAAIPLMLAVAGALALAPIYCYHVRRAGFVPERRTLHGALFALMAMLAVLVADQITDFRAMKAGLLVMVAACLIGVIKQSPWLGRMRHAIRLPAVP